MHLSRLYIENYKSIEKIDLKFEKGKNTIVGRNNSGKSNILKAIDLVLGEYSPTYNKSENITDNDFFCGNTELPIFIWCEISRDLKIDNTCLEPIDFTEVAKSAFFRVYNDKQRTSEIRVNVTDFNESEKAKIFEFCSDEGQARIDNNEFVKKWIGGKSYCNSNFETEFINKSKFAIAFTSVKNDLGKIEKELVLLYRENDTSAWIQGINCNLRNILIQSAIIPAFRDPKDQLRINAYTWFGKLLKAYVKTDSDNLNKAFGDVKIASDDLFKDLKK
jgi:putative ATP-dependent endonuclease of OLD family